MKSVRKVHLLVLLVVILGVLGVSCKSTDIGTVGTLPKKWWELPRGIIEQTLRRDSTGYYANVLAFVGMSDSINNFSESQALDAAKLDADTKLSQYIISKTTNIMRSATDVATSRLSETEAEVINRTVQEVTNRMQSTISIAQFSSFMIEGYHTEEAVRNGITYDKGWVVCTIQDELVEAIQKIQEEAFQSVMETTRAYAPVMDEIQKDISKMLV